MAFDDDFVHTISDNDEVSDLDENVAPPTTSASSKKRKRNGEDPTDASSLSKKRKSKDESSSKNSKKSKAAQTTDSEDESPAKARDSGVEVNYEDAELDSDFEFVVGDLNSGVLEDFDGWEEKSKQQEKAKGGLSLDEIIEKRRAAKGQTNGLNGMERESEEEDEVDIELEEDDDELLADDTFGMGATGEDESGAEDDDEEQDGEDSEAEESDDDSVAEPVPHPDDLEAQDESEEEVEDDEEAQRRRDFFAPESTLHGDKETNAKTAGSFQAMSLSRPILKGLSAVGFNEPTPIQAKAIPVALLGKDVVGSAVTGSGKTAAFMIPILERLLYRPKKVPTTRVAVLMPTRELAVQCFNVSKKLASFTDITFAQIVGGFSLREQENVLKQRPDVVIATPGRFIDHVKNSPSFAVDTLEILVLDEADRMLEDGFADELDEILNSIPKSRQTMLFSATMTESVDSLVRTGLNRPVRLMVDAKKQTVAGLVQEFIRLRPGKEDKRLAYLMYLCEKVYTERVIVFFGQKKEAHRVRAIFALCGLKASELHGSMSQEQRIAAIESFRSGTTNYLLATDLASRGLDIKNINTVLNYSVPRTHEIYVHRVGRTARAGRTGRACTLAAEPDRKVVRAAVKSAKAQGAIVQSRSIPEEDIARWSSRLKTLEDELEEVLEEEKEEKALNIADRELAKSDNLIKHEAEIHSRPKREWFQTEREKKAAALKGKPEGEGGKKKKLSGKEKKKLEDRDMRGEGKVWKKGKGDVKTVDDKSIGKDKKRELMKGNKRLNVPGDRKREEKPKIHSRGNKAGGKRK